jgi:hypothetical protein
MPNHNWEVSHGPRVCYAQVTAREVIVGQHYGSGHTDSAGVCSHAEFLAGRFQDLVRENLGEACLEEMLATVRGAPNDLAFAAERARRRGVQAVLDALPVDPSLPALLAAPGLVHGQWALYHGCPVALAAPDATFSIDRELHAVVHPRGGPAVKHTLPGYVSGAVFAGGVWVLNVGGVWAADTEGRRRSPEALAREPWGAMLRGWDVYAAGERVLFTYKWFDGNDGGPGVCEFRPDAGFVGHCLLDAPPPSAPTPEVYLRAPDADGRD